MKNDNSYRQLISAAGIGLFLLFTLIYALVFYLYRLPAEAVLYGALLGLIAVSPFFIWRRRSMKRKLELLRNMQQELLRDPDRYYLESCPPADNDVELEYQHFLLLLASDRERIRNQTKTSKNEMVEYYTLWVHQIKTPIAAIRLLLKSRDADPELSHQLFKIEEYVNMVLQYLRLDGESDLKIQWNDLDRIVRQAVHKYAALFIAKKLSLDYKPLNLNVLTDEKWLVFVIEQILSNAIKYTPAGGVTISLEEHSEMDRAALVIKDTGIGIALEDQPRIFDKGFTGENGHIDKRSTGIGLYLCRRILNQLSHGITVESKPGKGTAIRIFFDMKRLDVE